MLSVRCPYNSLGRVWLPKTLFGGDFLRQVLAADSLPGTFVHSRFKKFFLLCGVLLVSFPACFHTSFFPFCPLCWPALFPPPFLGTFSPFSPPRKVLCSVEQGAQPRVWSGAVPAWTSPQGSGRKFLPELCVKKVSFGPL